MLKFNLYDSNKSDIKWGLNRFPDGEVQLKDVDVSMVSNRVVELIAPIRNSEELFITIQAIELIKESVSALKITIPYLMGARNDRFMQSGRSVNLEVVLKLLISNLDGVNVKFKFICVHNELATLKNLANLFDGKVKVDFVYPFENTVLESGDLIVYPDNGAKVRFSKYFEDSPYAVGEKVRDINSESSAIMSYSVLSSENLEEVKRFVIVDDLVDGGGTFKLLSKELREVNPKAHIILKVAHAIQRKALVDMIEEGFVNEVHVTNSYADYSDIKGVKVVDILEV